MNEVSKKIFECGIVPVIKLEDASDAAPLCAALADGGIDVAEITFRTSAAEESIKNVSENLPNVLVGAGTVLSVDFAKKALAAGAKFIVTPGFNVRVVEYCLENNVPVFPGTSCPTDIEMGLSYGLNTMKFFPAEANGGLKTLKAISAPYGMVKFMPTGGIDATNITDYVRFDKIIAVGGSWMVKDNLIKAKNFAEITRLSKEAVLRLHGFDFYHMAINCDSDSEACGVMDKFNKAFGLPTREGSNSCFASDFIEIMKKRGPGVHGHIAIRTNNVARAIAYLAKQGFEVDRSTMRGTEEAPTFIYLQEPIGGFGVHLLQV